MASLLSARARAAVIRPSCRRSVISCKAAGTAERDASSTASSSGRPIVTYKPKAREVQPAPEEVPVVHSSAYLLKEQQAPAATPSAAKKRAQKRSAEDDVSGNAFEWALRRADAYFDKVESEGDANRSARSLVSNPATQATMKTMQLMKVALPVGKKLLTASADVLLTGLGAVNDASKRSRERRDKARAAEEVADSARGSGESSGGEGAREAQSGTPPKP